MRWRTPPAAITRWIERGNVEPAGDGAHGPVYRLRDVIGALSDAQLLGDPERRSRWGSSHAAEWAVRDLAKRLAKRLAEELLAALERGDRETYGGAIRLPRRGRLPEGGWRSLTDRELARRLRLLVQIGALEESV